MKELVRTTVFDSLTEAIKGCNEEGKILAARSDLDPNVAFKEVHKTIRVGIGVAAFFGVTYLVCNAYVACSKKSS